MNQTILEISKMFQVPPGDIMSKKRKMPLPTARHFVWGIAYARGFTQGQIAEEFKVSQQAVSLGITNFLKLNR